VRENVNGGNHGDLGIGPRARGLRRREAPAGWTRTAAGGGGGVAGVPHLRVLEPGARRHPDHLAPSDPVTAGGGPVRAYHFCKAGAKCAGRAARA
jgi:hypothetical protein